MLRGGKLRNLFFLFVVTAISLTISSCATTMNAVEHAKLQTQAKMTDTIFLEPVTSPVQKTVFIQLKNTSEVPLEFGNFLQNKLEAKGYQVIEDPYKANFRVQANVLYMGKESWHATMAGALDGGYGGTLAGLSMGHGYGSLAAAGAGTLIGSGLGMIAGAAIHVDRYLGVVDIRIKEKVREPIQTQVESKLEQEIGTTYHSTRDIKSQYQAYRTRIVASATRTNINLQEAVSVLGEKLATEIAGIF